MKGLEYLEFKDYGLGFSVQRYKAKLHLLRHRACGVLRHRACGVGFRLKLLGLRVRGLGVWVYGKFESVSEKRICRFIDSAGANNQFFHSTDDITLLPSKKLVIQN